MASYGRIKRTRAKTRRGPRQDFYEGDAKKLPVNVYVIRNTRARGPLYKAIACIRGRHGEKCSTVAGGRTPSNAMAKAMRNAAGAMARRKHGGFKTPAYHI